MDTYWKRFAAWAIGLRRNPFEAARLRLTFYYIFVLALILGAFGLFLYFATAQNINDTFERETQLNPRQEQILTQSRGRLKFTILAVDGVVLLLTAALSYVLAGKTLRPIKSALDAQSQFTADASHEFRTPLAIIKYNGDLALKNEHLGINEAREVIQSGVEETEHMSAIVERLLMLARNENGWDDFDPLPVDFSKIVSAALRNMKVLAANKTIKLSTTRIETAPVKGNAHALDQLVLNLVQNAIDYTPSGGSITVSIFSKDRHAHFTVEDSGIGIEEEDLPHIFKRFYKSDQARTMKQGGGLGLSIVQEIVNKHKGTIEITSSPGEGSVVRVTLPLA